LLVTVPQFEPLVTSAGGYPTEDDFRFLVIEGAGTFVLAPGEVHKVVIRFFAPLGEGKDTLVITSSSPGAEACLKVRVIGIIKRGPGAPGD
jgi:hypothetical protein